MVKKVQQDCQSQAKSHSSTKQSSSAKTFECPNPNCNKSFTTAQARDRHAENKHGILKEINKPFACSYCDKAYKNKRDLNDHMKDKHLNNYIEIQKIMNEQKFKCELCHGFTSNLRTHKYDCKANPKRSQPKQPLMSCIHCRQPLFSKRDFKFHMKTMHKFELQQKRQEKRLQKCNGRKTQTAKKNEREIKKKKLAPNGYKTYKRPSQNQADIEEITGERFQNYGVSKKIYSLIHLLREETEKRIASWQCDDICSLSMSEAKFRLGKITSISRNKKFSQTPEEFQKFKQDLQNLFTKNNCAHNALCLECLKKKTPRNQRGQIQIDLPQEIQQKVMDLRRKNVGIDDELKVYRRYLMEPILKRLNEIKNIDGYNKQSLRNFLYREVGQEWYNKSWGEVKSLTLKRFKVLPSCEYLPNLEETVKTFDWDTEECIPIRCSSFDGRYLYSMFYKDKDQAKSPCKIKAQKSVKVENQETKSLGVNQQKSNSSSDSENESSNNSSDLDVDHFKQYHILSTSNCDDLNLLRRKQIQQPIQTVVEPTVPEPTIQPKKQAEVFDLDQLRLNKNDRKFIVMQGYDPLEVLKRQKLLLPGSSIEKIEAIPSDYESNSDESYENRASDEKILFG